MTDTAAETNASLLANWTGDPFAWSAMRDVYPNGGDSHSNEWHTQRTLINIAQRQKRVVALLLTWQEACKGLLGTCEACVPPNYTIFK
jgi:hypothetical protein